MHALESLILKMLLTVDNADMKTINKDGMLLYGGPILEGYSGNTSNSKGFNFRGGDARNTEGIWFWSKPFIIPDPVTAGGKMAVLIMDTQGMWDGRKGQGLTASIFGLSTLLSSYQIYNVRQALQEDFLQHLALFTDYSIRIRDVGKSGDQLQEDFLQHLALFTDYSIRIRDVGKSGDHPPFQHIDFLVRDYANFRSETNQANCLKEMESYKNSFLSPRNSEDLNETRNQIKECYQIIDVYCLPHPGLEVSRVGYDGTIKTISAAFLNLLSNYISSIFTQGLGPIEINNRPVYTKDYES